MCHFVQNGDDFDLLYIRNVEDLMQKLYAIYYYMQCYPQIGDFPDSCDGHVFTVQGYDIIIPQDH